MHIQHYRRAAVTLPALCMVLSLLSGCLSAVSGAPGQTPNATPRRSPATQTPTSAPAPTATADSPAPSLWISPALPDGLRSQLHFPAQVKIVSQRDEANLWFEEKSPQSVDSQAQTVITSVTWTYVVAAPFPTVTDGVDTAALQHTWQSGPQAASGAPLGSQPILMAQDTRAVFEALWGAPSPKGAQVVNQSSLLDTAWQSAPVWAILPFEAIQPRWKVLRLQGASPLDRHFDAAAYPLSLPFTLYGSKAAAAQLPALPALTPNYDPSKMTVLVMTGTTAISRHIGERMESKGLTYPAQDIGAWLSDADLTHISNEVAFYQECPKPGPDRADMRFCSSPKYIQLLEAVGANIVELTGNHILDWGTQPFLDTLAMYQARGWKTFGGGENVAAAKKPLLIENHGNKLAFIGCSPAGPADVWATTDKPGSAPCDFDKMEQQIKDLRAAGYLPIVTFQAVETDTYKPAVAQGMPNFRRMAQAGAVIVSGSQSHVPQTMTFVGDNFVHYGLGNLFFDQMDPFRERQEFIDQHIFYNGKYLGVNLLTALLEDYSRPRPMTPAERSDFLQTIFALCDWSSQ